MRRYRMGAEIKMIVQFSGDLTIRTAGETRVRLMTALSSLDDIIELDCQSVDDIDLSFVHLIIACRKSAESIGRKLRLTAAARENLLPILTRSGVVQDSFDYGADRDHFWTEGIDQA